MSDATSGDCHRIGHVTSVIALLLTALLWTQTAAAASEEPERWTLRNLQGVKVVVENINIEVERATGLSQEQIQTDVELRLRKARIRVLTVEESIRTLASANLHVVVNVFRSDLNYVYSIHIGLNQLVFLRGGLSKSPIPAETWSASAIGITPSFQIRSIREGVADYVDKFINAYLAVNPP